MIKTMKRDYILKSIQHRIDEAKANCDACEDVEKAIKLKQKLNIQIEAYDFNVWLDEFSAKG